jgi:hypothetical protein
MLRNNCGELIVGQRRPNLVGHLRIHHTRRDAVHPDALPSQLGGQAPGQPDQCGFRRGVCRCGRRSHEGTHGTDKDGTAHGGVASLLPESLREHHRAVQIHAKRLVEYVQRQAAQRAGFPDSCGVHKTVERPVAVREAFDPFRDGFEIAEVERLGRMISGCHTLNRRVELIGSAASDDDPGPQLAQQDRGLAADSRRGTRDEYGAAAEIQWVRSIHHATLSQLLEPVLLGPVEDLFWGLGERFAGAFRVAVVFWLDGDVEAEPLKTALSRLQQRHPKLRAAIVRGSDKRRRYHFDQPTIPIPFEIIDHDEDEAPWRAETRRLLDRGFPAVGPFAAVTVVRNRSRSASVLIVSVHHAIADGLSGIMLVDDLLAEYADAEAHRETASRPDLRAVTAPRATTPPGWRHRVWLVRRLMRLQREDRSARQTLLPSAPDIPPQSQWVHWIFSREDTLRLVRRCRKERASLSGAMLAAICSALMDCLPVSQGLFKCQFPFDLRETLEGSAGPITGQDLGCFVSVMNQYYDVSQSPVFWDLARRADHDIQMFVQHGGPGFYYNIVSFLDWLFAVAGPVLSRPTPTRVTLLSTNYGVVNTRADYGSLRPRGSTLMFKNDVIGPSLVMEGLVMGQRLNIGLAADGLEPAFWERLQTAVRRHLDSASGSGDAQTAGAPHRTSVAPQE